MTDLHTSYLGLALRSPIVASPGPFTGDLDRLRELEQAGVGAVVLPSLFEEQIEHDTSEIDRLYSLHHDSFGEATSFFPELDDYNTGSDAYLDLVEAAVDGLDVPVIASLNGTNFGGWLRYARLLEAAGAAAIEFNLYSVAADPMRSGADVEAEQLDLVGTVAADLSVPVAVKISPYYSSLAAFLLGLQEAGAAGVVMFNRFLGPDLDLETLDIHPTVALSRPDEIKLPMRWIGIARDLVDLSLAASSGVASGLDVVKLILAGADVVMSTSSLLRYGPAHVQTMETELRGWMTDNEYESVGQMRGAVSRDSTADPNAYERAHYIGNLASYTSSFLAGRLDA
jgi:dihydroorotate dehydrogenase (fumarate)